MTTVPRSVNTTYLRIAVALATPTLLAQFVPASELAVRWTAAGHTHSVEGVAFSADGALVASAGIDSTVKVWRTADGSHFGTLVSPNDFGLHAVAFAPDGASIAAAGSGGAYLWRLSDSVLLREYCCLETGYSLDFSPDGTLLAVGGSLAGLEADVVLFRLSDGANLGEFVGQPQQYVLDVMFSPDGSTLIAAEGSPFAGQIPGVIRFWDFATGNDFRILSGHAGRIRALEISPDGNILASGSEDQTIRLWNLASGALLDTLTGHTHEVTSLDYSPDGALLASSSRDTSVKLWNSASGDIVRTIPAHGDDVAGVRFSPDGASLISCGGEVFGAVSDATVRLWDVADGSLERTLTQYGVTLEAVSFSRDGTLVAVGGAGSINMGLLEIRSAADGARLHELNGGTWLNAVAFSPDGTLLASGGWDNLVRLWNTSTRALVRTLSGHANAIFALAFSPDGQYLASATWDEPVRLWNAATGSLIRPLTSAPPAGGRALAFSPDSQFIAVGASNFIRIWRASDGALQRTIVYAPGGSTSLATLVYAPDGSLLASSGDTDIKLWNPATGAHVRTLSGHAAYVKTLAFSPDGQFLISGCETDDRTLRFWRVSDGALLATIDDQTGTAARRVDWSADNRQIAIARRDSTLTVVRNPFGPSVGDVDADGDIDVVDQAAFVDCLSAPNTPPAPLAPPEALACHTVFDIDSDHDVDLLDFASVQQLAPAL